VIGLQKQANGKCYLRSIKCTVSGVQFPGVTKLTERLLKLLPRRERRRRGEEEKGQLLITPPINEVFAR